MRNGDLPLCHEDQAEPVGRTRSEIRAADGLPFVTSGCTGGLEHAIDRGSRPYGQSA